MIRKLLIALVLLGILTGGAIWWAIAVPWKASGREVFVDIPSGTGTQGIARLLLRAGVIRAEWQFLLARTLRPGARLQAGEYRFQQPLSVLEVFRRIELGDVFYYELRVPEGSNIFDIANEVEKLGFIRGSEFLKIAKSSSLIRDLAPAAPTLEGYLFPSTYRVTRRTSARQICQQMTSQFRRAWKQLGGTARDVNRYVTLASLVEKETGVPAERPEVASVYHNRLGLGMKLDCDPTVIYAALLEGRYRGTIYRSDLDNPHPYNTYRNPGLPPGAIANPGLESLKAALHPAETKYLFFVAKPDGSGGHTFSETIAGHNLAVQQYRSGLAH